MHILWHPLNGPICALEAVMDGDTQIYFQLLGADHLTFEGGGGVVIYCWKGIFFWDRYVPDLFFLSHHHVRYFFCHSLFRSIFFQ
jgi:hypothetical protein